MTSRAARTRPGVLAVVALVLLALVLAACDSAVPSPSPSPTFAPEPTPVVTTYPVDTTVWYEGLQVTFATATAVLDPDGGTLTVGTTFANPGSDDQALDAPIELMLAGTPIDPQHGTVIPTVPAGGSSPLDLVFQVLGRSTVTGASIVVGNGDANQATVPLEAATGAAVTLKPIPVSVKGVADAGDLRLVFRGGQLRWDLPDWTDELPRGHAALTLTYDAQYRGSFSGGVAFTADNVRLTLPDGSTIAPRRDGHSQTIALVLPNKTQARLSSRFELPAVEHGRYVVTLRNGTSHGTFAFTISG